MRKRAKSPIAETSLKSGSGEAWARQGYRAAGAKENLLLSVRHLKWEAVLEWLMRE